MRKVLSFILFIALAFSCVFGLADTITVDTESATIEEIEVAIDALNNQRITLLKTEIPPIGPPEEGEIVFRSVPWYSTREETEAAIGYNSSTTGPTDIYRMSAIDYDSVTSGDERVDDLGGCMAYYRGMTVAGLQPSKSYICYLYPIVDGTLIRDDALAQIYFAYYKFSRDDFGDHKAIYDDLQRKLNSTYGTGKEESDKYHTWTKWTDKKGNYIQLIIDNDYDYAALGYIAGDADKRLDDIQVAITAEKAAEDQQKLEMNQENYDGL